METVFEYCTDSPLLKIKRIDEDAFRKVGKDLIELIKDSQSKNDSLVDLISFIKEKYKLDSDFELYAFCNMFIVDAKLNFHSLFNGGLLGSHGSVIAKYYGCTNEEVAHFYNISIFAHNEFVDHVNSGRYTFTRNDPTE